jgi:UDP-4-amino-4,6-dideoxy-N-acetyl-beta-L-altrosamine transaminase
MPIPYGRQSIDETDVAAVDEALRSDWLTQGPHVEAFEAAVAERCEVPYAVAFSSGTAALHGAAFAAGLGEGDESVTSAITFAASANCAAYVGATPRFADIEPATFNVSAATIEPVLTERTRAVIPVHFTGLPAPIAEIRELVGAEVTIIEDAAQALGAATPDEPVGSCLHSEMTMLSFHPVKAVTSAEGGIVTTRDAELRDRMLRFRNHGINRDAASFRDREQGGWYYEQDDLGFNYRLSDLHSALGRSQMAKLDGFIEARNAIADRYREWLADIEAIELPPEAPAGSRHAYHLFVIRLRGGADARRRLYDQLREREILAQVHHVPVHLHPYYRDRYGYEPGLCPDAEAYYASCLSLPCFPALTSDDQRTVTDAVRELVE